VVAVAALNIRNLDETVKRRLQIRAARHGRSMEADRDRRELRTTAITLAEVRYGIARLPDGRRKQVLLAAADDIFLTFEEQVLPVDAAAAEHYAAIASRRERAGKPIAGFDALIAAVCRCQGADMRAFSRLAARVPVG
jgi:plasmid stability protein